MPRKSKTRKTSSHTAARPTPDAATFIDAPQVCERYGGRSHMWLERLLERDATFPRPVKIGRLRFFPIAALIEWERRAAAESNAA